MSVEYSLPTHLYDIGLDGYMDLWRGVLVKSIDSKKHDVRQVTVGCNTFSTCKELANWTRYKNKISITAIRIFLSQFWK